MQKVAAVNDEHKSNVMHWQDREETLSSETVQFTRELAAAERKRQDSEAQVRQLTAQLREAEEGLADAKGLLEDKVSECRRKDAEMVSLGKKVKENQAEVDSVKEACEAELRETKKKLEEAQLELRQQQKLQASVPTSAGRGSGSDPELEAQLSKLCEEVLAKQVAFEQVTFERAALRSRLETATARISELQEQVTHFQTLRAPTNFGSLEAGVSQGGGSIGDAMAALFRSKDIPSAFYNLDELLRVSAQAVASDSAVRSIAGIYLLLLQFSAMTVLVHAILGKHH